LKTQENLDVVRSVPLDRIMLETGKSYERSANAGNRLMVPPDLPDTDAPWCSITTTAASHAYLPKDGPYVAVEKTKTLKPGGQTGVKGRNEPADVSIDWIVAGHESEREGGRLIHAVGCCTGDDNCLGGRTGEGCTGRGIGQGRLAKLAPGLLARSVVALLADIMHGHVITQPSNFIVNLHIN
jgi:hypothetical protein